jgi:hypothetical protein
MAHGFFIIIQTFPANPVLVSPLGMLLENHLDDVMIGMLQKNHQIMLDRLLANRANITVHLEPFSGGIFPNLPREGSSLNELALRYN